MKRIWVLLGILAAACGKVDERAECSADADCPVGQYCARTGDGNVCWADSVAPTVSNVAASCAGGCRRDSMLLVTADVDESTSGIFDATVSLDLPGGSPVPMARSGAQLQASVDLRQFPFDAFERSVVATVTARDGARNVSEAASAPAVNVSRLLWDRAVDDGIVLSPTAPAVMPDGTVVIAASTGGVYLVTKDGVDVQPDPLVVGAGQITAAPAVGEHAIWIGSEDFSLYAVALDGSGVLTDVGVSLGGPIKGSVAVVPGATKDWAFATCATPGGTGFIGAASTSPGENDLASTPDGFKTGPVLGAGDPLLIHATTATGTNDATLRTFTFSTAPVVLSASWTAAIEKGSAAPLAVDLGGAVVSASEAAPPVINRTLPGPTAAPQRVGDLLAFASDTAIALSGGDIVVGDSSGRLHRFGASGPVWSPAPNLGSAIAGPMALAGTTAPLIVPTNAGKVYALDDDGQTKWEVTLPSAVGLRAGNIYTPPGQVGPIMSTAYFASGNGRLYAVIVDGQLDADAPWPKAFHDPRNTNRAGPQP